MSDGVAGRSDRLTVAGYGPLVTSAPTNSPTAVATDQDRGITESGRRSGDLTQVHRVQRTRASSTWTALAVAVILAIALLVFIFQNGTSVPVHFLGADGRFPLALGLLASAVAGALVVLIPGLVRMAQLRRTAKRHRSADIHTA